MKAKELKRLSRNDLLEMLLALSKENDLLRAANAQLKKQVEDRNIAIGESGSLAEAALKLNGLFEAAQAACDQYTENIRTRSETLEAQCAQRERETQEKCEAMLAQARTQAEAYLTQAREQQGSYSWLAGILENEKPKDEET